MEILTNFCKDLYTSKNIKTENINSLLQSIDIEKKVSQNDNSDHSNVPNVHCLMCKLFLFHFFNSLFQADYHMAGCFAYARPVAGNFDPNQDKSFSAAK